MNKYKLHVYNYDAIEDIDYTNFDLIITNPFGDLNLLKISILAYMEENSWFSKISNIL